jgi:hypothetical protein
MVLSDIINYDNFSILCFVVVAVVVFVDICVMSTCVLSFVPQPIRHYIMQPVKLSN